MHPPNPNYKQICTKIFCDAPFIQDVGYTLDSLDPGICRTSLKLEPKHFQQNGFVHAGVLATMADHTAGTAAGTMVEEGQSVLTIEFKINLLRPAVGKCLQCVSQIIKPGKRVTFCESEIFDENKKLVAKASVTLAVM
ncbi:PaaI family thioesterase [bacterium]|nr:PaaI family thioesterase [bacterium]